jgi:probable F420-dependent oxidoreductase
MDLGTVGVWWSASWRADDGSTDVVAELEELGFGALWSSGGFEPGLALRFERMLSATVHVIVASGIVSVWATSPEVIAPAVADLEARYPGRFVLGLGVSHAPIVEDYAHPHARMVAFLDALDGGVPEVGKDRRVLAALGPRMLALARDRAAGAHPYFVPVEHTAYARAILGQGPVLAPEVTVVLEDDPETARNLARTFAAGYLTLPNYVDNLRRLGFGDEDLAHGGSDRLVDAVVAWGDVDTVASRIREHRAAGADHVCVQVLPTRGSFPVAAYRELAPALLAI